MKRWTMFIAIAGWLLGSTCAYAIIVDGNPADWSGIQIYSTIHEDPFADASPGLDLDETWFYWDKSADWFYFGATIYNPTTGYGGADPRTMSFARTVINSIPGGQNTDDYEGADFAIHYTIGAVNARFEVWDGTDWATQTYDEDNPQWAGAYDSDNRFLEFGIAADNIEGSDYFVWGISTDDNGSGTDDLSPNTMDQIGTPEPASVALMGLALAGVAAFRKRRKSD